MHEEKLTQLISLPTSCLTVLLICERGVGGLFGTNSWISMTECTCKSETVIQSWTWTLEAHTFFFSSVSPLDGKQLRKPLYSLVVGPLMRHNVLPGVFWGQHGTMEVATKAMWRAAERGWSRELPFFPLYFKKCELGCGPTGRRRHSTSIPPPFPHSLHPSCLILISQMPSESTARQKQTPKEQWAFAGKQKRERK